MNGPITLRPKVAPCEAACPAGIDVPRYVRQVAQGRFDDALATIRERIPFPLVCGYACFHPCEAKCGRGQFEGPVAIRMLKRVAAEAASAVSVPSSLAATGKRVAIIGSGPCGLTAAWYLALLGHEVTVFEALEQTGGMLRYGIPSYRLPDDVIDADVRLIEAAGVTLRTATRVASAEALLAQGHHAVLVAAGAWRASDLDLAREPGARVLKGIEFLEAVNAGRAPQIGARVAVIGGGDTAIDAARVSRRLGAEVVMIYRRTRVEMPADPDEVEGALDEGVVIEFLASPVHVTPGTLSCQRMELTEADANGRRDARPVAGSDFAVEADTVILAVGQQVSIPDAGIDRAPDGTLRVDAATLATSLPGVFAGGDAVTGPASIIDAIAQGQRAGSAIDRFLGGTGDLERFAAPRDAGVDRPASPRGTARVEWRSLSPAMRLRSFDLVEQAYDRPAAMREAGRCLSCDQLSFDVRVDPALCKDCGYCDEVCGPDVFERSDAFNASGYQPYDAARPEACIGCLRCLYICPDFAITVTNLREAPPAA